MYNLVKLLNIYFPIWDFLYLLQLEEYELKRYLWQVNHRLFKRGFQKRDRLRYTGRIKLTIFVLLATLGSLFAELIQAQMYVHAALLVAILPLITPYLIAVTSAVVGVTVNFQKKRRLRAASTYFRKNYPDTKVIAITGSFGKTTTKYMLQHVLQYEYRTAIIPDNINTGIGIANHILADKVPKNTELLIVEMGAYRRGDIAEATSVVEPNYSVLTILGDQHIERFGSFADLVHGKAEIYTTAARAVCYTTKTAKEVLHKHNLNTQQLIAVQAESGPSATKTIVTKLALDLGVSQESIDASLASFFPPGRRNNIIERQGVTIIDNSYNISPMVAEAMLQNAAQVAKEQNKKLVVMTGGIGEQGDDSAIANREFAKQISTYATRAILHPSIYAADIESALRIPCIYTDMGLDVSEQPAQWLDPDGELLLWLTDHSDAVYL